MARSYFPPAFVSALLLFTWFPSSSSGIGPSYLEESLPGSAAADFFVQDLVERYADFQHNDFWQPYSYSTGSVTREVVRIERVDKRFIPGRYIQWKYARLGFGHYIVGITEFSIDVYGSELQKLATFATSSSLVALTLYSRWDFDDSRPELVIPVATKRGIEIYKFVNGQITKVDEDWPLQYQIKALEFCHIRAATKLIVIPTEARLPVNIYNIVVNKTSQVWYHEQLYTDKDSHVVVYDVGSESFIAISTTHVISVYTYDHEKGQYTKYQTIALSAPSTQLVSFTLAYKHYLASVAGPSQEVEFFGYNGNQYSKEANLSHINAVQIHSLHVEDYRDEQVILARYTDGQIHVLSYDGTVFKEEYNCNSEVCATNADMSKGVGFTGNGTTHYFLPSRDSSNKAEVLVVTNIVQDAISPLYEKSRDVFAEFADLSKRFARWETIVSSVKTTLQDSLSTTSSNTVTGQWTIEVLSGSQVVIAGGESSQYNYNNQTSLSNIFRGFTFLESAWTDQDVNTTPSDIDSKLNKLKTLANDAKIILKDSIPLRSEEIHKVRAKQTVTGSFSTPYLLADSIQVGAINQQYNLSQFLSSLVLKEDSIFIQSSVSFYGELSIKNLYTKELNGILVSDIARLSKPNVFSCPLRFNNLFTVNGNIEANLIGGVDLSEEIIRANDISGVNLADGVVALKEATVSSPIDSIYVNKDAFENILLSSTSQRISVPFTFTDVQSRGKSKTNLLNGESFIDFTNQIILRDFQGLIRGHKTIRGSMDCESLRIDRYLNDYKFPEDLMSRSQRRLTISGLKNFTQLSASKVIVDGEVDGINTATLISRLGYDSIKATWRFKQGVEFLDDLIVRELVDGVRMERLKHTDTLDQFKSSYYPDADIEFRQPTYIKNLNIDDKINNQAFEQLFGGILLFDSREITIGGSTTFKSSVAVDALTVNSGVVNGINLDHLVTLNTAQNISGSKIFEDQVNFSSLYALSLFDTVNLAQLFDNAFWLSKSRTISSKLSFEEITCGSSMTVSGKINNIHNFESNVAVTTGRDIQVFESPVDFMDFTAEYLNVTGQLQVEYDKTIGGLNFNSWYNRRISLSKDFEVSVPFEITGYVQSSQNINTQRINGIPLSYLSDGVLRSDRASQTFLEFFETTGLVSVKDGYVEFDRNVSGFSINNIIRNAFPLSGSNTEVVSSDWEFQSLVITNDLTVNGYTCGVDLVKLDVDSVRIGESDVYIFGETTFPNGFDITKDLKVSKVNSIDLFSNVFTLNTVQNVEREFHFASNVYVEELLSSNGYINEVSLAELARIYSFENGTTHVLKYDVECEDHLESTSLSVHQLVQGLDFKKYLLNNVVKLSSDLKITGEKTFLQPIIVQGNIDVYEVNGINVATLASSVVYKSDSVRFTSPVTFENFVQTPELQILYGDLLVKGRVGEGNLTELILEAFYTNSGRLVKHLSFESIQVIGNIDGVKYLNGIELEKVITLDGSQSLGSLNVKSVRLEGSNVAVNGLIQGYDFPMEYARTFLRYSDRTQIVTGTKEFEGKIYISGNLQCLGGLPRTFFTLSDSHTIATDIQFTGLVRVLGDLEVTGLVDGYSLSQLVDEALTYGKEEIINGEWTFTEGVTFKDNVDGSTILDGHDLGELLDDKKSEALTAEAGVRDELAEFEEKCHYLDALYQQVSKSPVRLEFFENHQDLFVLRNKATKIISISSGVHTKIALFSETCEISFLQWNSETELFQESSDKLRLGYITRWESTTHENQGILVYTTQSSSCSSVNTGLYVVTMDSYGNSSPARTIALGTFAHIEVVHNEQEMTTTLLVVGEDTQKLNIYIWQMSSQEFTLELETQLSSHAERFEAVAYLDGVAVFYHCDAAVHMEHFQFGRKQLTSYGDIKFLAINGTLNSPMVFFENHHILYGLVQSRHTQKAVVQPECNLQAFQSYDGDLKLFQSLQSKALVSMTTLRFSQQVYIAALTKQTGLNLYRYKGLSGFELLPLSPIKVSDGVEIISFNLEIWNYNLARPFIVISTGRTIQIIRSSINGDLKEYEDLRNSLCKVV